MLALGNKTQTLHHILLWWQKPRSPVPSGDHNLVRMKTLVMNFNPLNDRVMLIKLMTSMAMNLIQVYAPIGDKSDDIVEDISKVGLGTGDDTSGIIRPVRTEC